MVRGLCIATLLLVACDDDPRAPIPQAVEPQSGVHGQRTSIRVKGRNFSPLIKANYDDESKSVISTQFALRLGSTPLEAVTFVSHTELTAVVPAGLPRGVHTLEVEDPAGRRGELKDAFEVLGGADAGADLAIADGGDGGGPDLPEADLPTPDLPTPDLPDPDLPAPCGNKQLDSGESCDDGNTTAGDGCSASCQIEDGYLCPTPGSACAKVQSVVFGGNAVDTPRVGGLGGSARQRVCASDALMVGVDASSTRHPGWYPESLTELVVRCRRFRLNATGALQWRGSADTTLSPLGAPQAGDPLTALGTIRCAKDQFVVTTVAHPTGGGNFVQGLVLGCAPLLIKLGALTPGTVTNTALIGLSSTSATAQVCPAGKSAVGFAARSGNVVDALMLRCADVSLN